MTSLQTPLPRLQAFVMKRFPQARTEYEVYNAAAALDIWLNGFFYPVLWRPRTGFEVMVKQDAVFGERPDESYRSMAAVQRRLTTLLNKAQRNGKLAKSA